MKELISELKLKNVYLSIDNDELVVDFDGENLPDDLISKIKDSKSLLIDYLRKYSETVDYFEISPISPNNSYPTSSAQMRLWVLSQFEDSSVAYNMPGSIAIEGEYELDLFQKSFDSVIERHEILRTVFKEGENGEIKQYVLKKEELAFIIDYKDYRNDIDKKEKANSYIAADSYKPFDLEKGPLLRGALLQLNDESYIFYFNMHHIISDGWSMNVLTKDVLAYYWSYKQNKKSGLKELLIQYKDYSAWQLSQLNKGLFKAHREYWLNNLQGELPLLDLPFAKQRPKIKTHNGRRLTTYLDSKTTVKLRQYTQERGGSLFVGLFAALNVLFYRYTLQDDIIIGTPVAGRDHVDLEDQIGFYINTLALRNVIKSNDSFDSFYERLKDNTFNSFSHQSYPFDRIVDELNLQRDTSRSALFDVIFTLQTNKESEESEVTKEESNRIVDFGYCASKFDLDISVREIGNYLSLRIEYNTDIYEKEMVERLIRHYKRLLNILFSNPGENISQIDYLSDFEKNSVLIEFNNTKVHYQTGKTIVDLFEDQVLKTPDAIALVFEDKELSYAEINSLSNRLANSLRENFKIGPNDLVGIMLERSQRLIISVLGVLKSGAAYVPIDIEYPKYRKEFIIKDAGVKVLITETSQIFDIEYYEGALFAIDVQLDGLDNNGDLPLSPIAGSKDLAYVIYTSGSTGKPKGCGITHNSFYNYIEWSNASYFKGHKENFGLFTSLSFDLTITSIFCTLTQGGRLFIYGQYEEVTKILEHNFDPQSGITSIKLTPSHINLLSNLNLRSISMKYAIVGGEAVTIDHVNILKQINSEIVIYNEYGPTEATVGCIMKQLEADEQVSIGRPISNTQIFILDSCNHLLPIGIVGEICISGACLARGYINKPELTQEKFVDNPFKPGERMYRTGDLGRWLANGNIEFTGRKDDQVKIRGYRIELEEIESVMVGYEKVQSCVVLACENSLGEKNLVAYFVSEQKLMSSDLKSYASSFLPSYMVPSCYMQMEAMPLTINGKIDKKSLPPPEGFGRESGLEYVAPRNEIERQMVAIWSEVLGIAAENISVMDDFFNLGGDSIKSITVVSQLRQNNYTLLLRDIMTNPILENLASQTKKGIRRVNQNYVEGDVFLSPIQKYFFDQKTGLKNHYNQAVVLSCKEPISGTALHSSLNKLFEHHDALRMTYYYTKDGWKQNNNGLNYACFFEESEYEDEEKYILECDKLQSSINLSEGPLFKVKLFKGNKGNDRILLVVHHLVMDGVSWRILVEDLSTLYKQFLSNVPFQLPLKTDSFKDWLEQQMIYSKSEILKKEKPYWLEMESLEVPKLKKEIVEGENLIKNITTETFALDERLTNRLLTKCYRLHQTDINDILLTALCLSLSEVFEMNKMLINLEGHGREDIGNEIDISRTIGWFTTIYPVVFDISFDKDFISQLIEVKKTLRRVPNKGIGYGILRYLSNENYKLSPEIIFNYLGDFGSKVYIDKEKNIFDFSGDYQGKTISDEMIRSTIFDFTGFVIDGIIRLSISYSNQQYSQVTIKSLMAAYKANLISLIEELSIEDSTEIEPKYFTYKGIKINEQFTNEGSFIELNKIEKTKVNMYFLPPVIGASYIYKPIAAMLNEKFNCYGYNLAGGEEGEVLNNSIEEIACQIANKIGKSTKNVEMVIIGYSFGGEIAFEVAKILEENQIKNYKLIIIDQFKGQESESEKEQNEVIRKEFIDQGKGELKGVMSEMQIDKFAAMVRNNYLMLDEYEKSGLIDNDILTIETTQNNEIIKMKNWKKFTNGQVKVEKLVDVEHPDVFTKDLQSVFNKIMSLLEIKE